MREAKKDNNNKTQKAPNLSPHPQFREKEEPKYAGFVITKSTKETQVQLKDDGNQGKGLPWRMGKRGQETAHLMVHCCMNFNTRTLLFPN